MKKLRITVEGRVYDVQVELLDEGGQVGVTPRPVVASRPVALETSTAATASAAAAVATSSAVASGAGDVVSPLAGKVVSIDVKVGQPVEAGAQVATIEAMKMNTYIYAPKGGTVAEIVAKPGDGVEEGAPLVRLA